MKTEHKKLLDFLLCGEGNYTVHHIKKSKPRMVFEPNEKLRALQKFAVQKVFAALPVSKYSTAYEKGCSILRNAAAHKKAKYIAKYDIADFFGSVSYTLFSRVLSKKRYSQDDIKLLWLIVSLRGGLPVGAYSSPFVSNRLLFAFDKAIGKAFPRVTYTRYADDMAFSSAEPLPPRLEGELALRLGEAGLALNPKKSRTYTPKSPKRITGISINEKGLTVGKRYKRALKKRLYDFTVKGKGNARKLAGHLAHLRLVEPDYYRKLIKKYNFNEKRKGK